MSSKFILHGGGGQFSEINDLHYYRAIAEAVPTEFVRVLHIGFAIHAISDKWKLNRQIANGTKEVLEYANPHKTFEVTPAILEGFETDVLEADVLFVYGGDGDVLRNVLQCYDFTNWLDGKVCAGFSAGANIWSTIYYSNDNQDINEGLGVLPIATFCHYNEHKWDKLTKLSREATQKNLAVIPLSDNGYVIL